jgi:hypothetical protein
MTYPVVVMPDVEAWVWANIRQLPGVTSFTYSVQHGWPHWLVAHFLQIDARAKSKQAASDLAEQVRQIVCALPGVPWAEGVCSYVQPVEGPFWMADPDGGPRYCARYEIRAHPLPVVP